MVDLFRNTIIILQDMEQIVANRHLDLIVTYYVLQHYSKAL